MSKYIQRGPNPQVTIEYDGPEGRVRKTLQSMGHAKSFYTRKDREGKRPIIVGTKENQ